MGESGFESGVGITMRATRILTAGEVGAGGGGGGGGGGVVVAG